MAAERDDGEGGLGERLVEAGGIVGCAAEVEIAMHNVGGNVLDISGVVDDLVGREKAFAARVVGEEAHFFGQLGRVGGEVGGELGVVGRELHGEGIKHAKGLRDVMGVAVVGARERLKEVLVERGACGLWQQLHDALIGLRKHAGRAVGVGEPIERGFIGQENGGEDEVFDFFWVSLRINKSQCAAPAGADDSVPLGDAEVGADGLYICNEMLGGVGLEGIGGGAEAAAALVAQNDAGVLGVEILPMFGLAGAAGAAVEAEDREAVGVAGFFHIQRVAIGDREHVGGVGGDGREHGGDFSGDGRGWQRGWVWCMLLLLF